MRASFINSLAPSLLWSLRLVVLHSKSRRRICDVTLECLKDTDGDAWVMSSGLPANCSEESFS